MNLTDLAGRATLSVPETASLLGIGRDAAYDAVTAGTIPHLRIGRTIRVPVPKLLAMLGAARPVEAPASTTLTLVDDQRSPPAA